MRKKFFTIIAILMLLGTVYMAQAFGPITHPYLGERAVLTAPDSTYKSIALANLDDYLLGSEQNDIAVIFYFSSFDKDYQATHNWEWCQYMLNVCAEEDNGNGVSVERQKAYALGCFAHAAADSYSHNTYVPYYLNKYKFLDEASLHPMVEEALDYYYVQNVPGINDRTNKVFAHYTDFILLLKCANGRSDSIGGITIPTLVEIHKKAVVTDGFYEAGYGGKASESNFGTRIYFFWKMFQVINKPFAEFVIKIEGREQLETIVISRIQATLDANPEKTLDPTGAVSLRNANKTPSYIQLFISGGMALTLLFFARKKRWQLATAGISAALSAFIMWYFGFLGILFVWMILWVLSWPYLIWLLIKKFKLKKKYTLFDWIVLGANIIADLILLWIWFL